MSKIYTFANENAVFDLTVFRITFLLLRICKKENKVWVKY